MTYKIVSKYIKNLDFKIPSAKSYYLLEKNIKNYRVKIDVTSKKINDMVVEIDTNLYFEPKNKNTDNFKISIIYSAVINFEKSIDKEQLEKVVLIETPTAVFPDISKIVSSLFEKSGFKQFSLPEMDFKKFYEERKKN
tara:strand:- start:916 stop:1329 length:414 start_codon:yes stop_codon:yes gene_type:complete